MPHFRHYCYKTSPGVNEPYAHRRRAEILTVKRETRPWISKTIAWAVVQ